MPEYEDNEDLNSMRQAFEAIIRRSDLTCHEDNPFLAPTVDNLRTVYASLQTTYVFKPGDLITWKPYLRNRKVPEYGVPAMVIQIVENNIDPTAESGTPYWKEDLNIQALMFWRDGQIIRGWLPGDLFQPYQEPE